MLQPHDAVCCKRSAVNRTVFTDELSERNTEIILCNTFFCGIFWPSLFHQAPNLAVPLQALDATTILIPAIQLQMSKHTAADNTFRPIIISSACYAIE